MNYNLQHDYIINMNYYNIEQNFSSLYLILAMQLFINKYR